MEKKVLQSMTEFVIGQVNPDHLECHEFEEAYRKVVAYSDFLQRKLELWMFVPCDDKGNVLPDNLDFDDRLCGHCPLEKKGVYGVDGGYMAGCEGSRCEEAKENYSEIYQQAKDRVLFEGFQAIEKKDYNIVTKNGVPIWMTWTSRTIETLVGTSTVLTDSAIKKIYGN